MWRGLQGGRGIQPTQGHASIQREIHKNSPHFVHHLFMFVQVVVINVATKEMAGAYLGRPVHVKSGTLP